MDYGLHDRIPMQYLIIGAAQDPTFDHDEVFGGAAVGCWIKDQTKDNAYHIAKGRIENQGWVVLELEEQKLISEEDYESDGEGKEYFEQALTDDEVFVFYTYPKDEKPNKGLDDNPKGVSA